MKKRTTTRNKNKVNNCDLNNFEIINECADNNLLNLDVEEVTLIEQSRSISVQYDLLTDINNSAPQVEKHDVEVNTTIITTHDLRIENFRDPKRSEELHFYTGFNNYEHFMIVYGLLGPQVNNLRYYPHNAPMKQGARALSQADEFFLTVIKLRHNMLMKELGYRIKISVALVSRIFITWVNLLFCQFKELNLRAPYRKLKDLMKYKGKNCTSTVIIDCTEIPIKRPENPLSQQQTYSNYKSCNTLKILVGMSPTGTVTFVCDAYGGTISDRWLRRVVS